MSQVKSNSNKNPGKTNMAHEATKSHHTNAMQHYLEYLKSDAGPIDDETRISFTPSVKDIWTGPVMYPPFED